jgi:oxalate decarboxylase/phosphoglucose isomerase-like protein (cupin superfamily)
MSVSAAPFEYRQISADQFHAELAGRGKPAVFRALVADWPAVAAGKASPETLSDYLRKFDRGRPAGAMIGPPEIRGRFSYDEALIGFNFKRQALSVSEALDFLLAAAQEESPSSMAIQGVPVRANLPGFEAENRLPLLDSSVEPRIWLGNKVTVAAHNDPAENIGCVVAGRRRFTIFPPEQIANLYVGPFEKTPAGPTISVVDFDNPDPDRYPKFAAAMEAAIVADLEPGDAIYIPYMWWHHVRSLDTVNLLVNYWWTPPAPTRSHPVDAMLHAMMAIKELPEAHRAAWRAHFDHYVFQTSGPPGDHLPEERRGVLGTLDEDKIKALRTAVLGGLNRS